MADDDVQLTDLEVIQRFSLAVRGATASRAEVVAALEADLAFLSGSRRRATPAVPVAKAPVKAPVKATVKATKAPAKKATRTRA